MWIIRLFFKGVMCCIGWMPLPVVYGMGRGLGFLIGRVIRYRRTESRQRLERSIPCKTKKEYRRIINGMYRTMGITLFEAVHYYPKETAAIGKALEFDGAEHMENAFKRGKGVIVLTMHFGSFDLIPIIAVYCGYRSSVITKKIRNRLAYDLWVEARQRDGLTYLPARHAYRDCLKALKRNEAIGFILDQNMTRKEGIFVDFFGRPACTSPGMAVMSAHSGAPVVPIFVYRRGNQRHLVKFLPAMEPPPDRSPESIHAATQAYTKVLEDAIRETPDHWIWIHRRWRTVPPTG